MSNIYKHDYIILEIKLYGENKFREFYLRYFDEDIYNSCNWENDTVFKIEFNTYKNLIVFKADDQEFRKIDCNKYILNFLIDSIGLDKIDYKTEFSRMQKGDDKFLEYVFEYCTEGEYQNYGEYKLEIIDIAVGSDLGLQPRFYFITEADIINYTILFYDKKKLLNFIKRIGIKGNTFKEIKISADRYLESCDEIVVEIGLNLSEDVCRISIKNILDETNIECIKVKEYLFNRFKNRSMHLSMYNYDEHSNIFEFKEDRQRYLLDHYGKYRIILTKYFKASEIQIENNK